MAITQRGSATLATTTGETDITADKPTGTVADDVLIALMVCNNQTVTPPAGWTQFIDETIEVFGFRGFYKVAGGSEPASYTFTVPSNTPPLVLGITAWTGVDTSDVFDIDVETETATTHSEPYTTPSLSGAGATAGRVFYTRAVREVGSTPATMTESTGGISELFDHGQFSGGSVSYSNAMYADDADYSGTGGSAGLAITASLTEEHNVVATWALKGAAIPGVLDVNATTILPVVDMTGSQSNDGTMDVIIPLTQVNMDGLGNEPEGSMSVSIPLTDVTITAGVQPSGTLDIDMPIEIQFGAEGRIFADNVIVVEPDIRVVQVVDSGITPSTVYTRHPG